MGDAAVSSNPFAAGLLRPKSPNPPPSFAPLISSPLAHTLPSPPSSQDGHGLESEATPSLPDSELSMEDTMMTDEDEAGFVFHVASSSAGSDVDGDEAMPLHSDEPAPPSSAVNGPARSSFLSPPQLGFHQSTGSSSPGPSWLPGLQGAGAAGLSAGAGFGYEAAARRKRASGYKQRPAQGSSSRRGIQTPPASSSSASRSSSPSPSGPSAVFSSKAYSKRSPPSIFPGIDSSAPAASSSDAARLRSLAAEQFRTSRRKERLVSKGTRKTLDMFPSFEEGQDMWDEEDTAILGALSKRSLQKDWRGWGEREGERGWGSSPGSSFAGEPGEDLEWEETQDEARQPDEDVPSDIEDEFVPQVPKVVIDTPHSEADEYDQFFDDADFDEAALAALEGRAPSSSNKTVTMESIKGDQMVS